MKTYIEMMIKGSGLCIEWLRGCDQWEKVWKPFLLQVQAVVCGIGGVGDDVIMLLMYVR